jgi:uncharacterized protein YjbI with pentapeptide repeats
MYRRTRRAGAAFAVAATVLLGTFAATAPAQAAAVCPVIAADGTPGRVPYSGVDWSGCDLTGANLAGADLRLANLTGATLTGANLTGARLDYVDLTRASAQNATFTDATGHRGTYEDAHLEGATFTRSVLTISDMDSAHLEGATFTGADLGGAHLWSATMNNARVSASSFRGADTSMLDLRGATIDASNFSSSRLNVANLAGATIRDTNFTDANLLGAYFLEPVTATGNTWTGATCADGQYSTRHERGDCLRPLDETAPAAYYPTVTGPGTGVGHWYTGPVSINWNWYDTGGLSATACTTATTGVYLTGTVTASCADTAGNVGTSSYDVRIDRTAPALSATVSHAPNGTNGWYRTAPTVRYTCGDTGSGVASCPRAVTAAQGARTITATARDVAGNATTNATAVKLDSVKPTVSVSRTTLNSYGAQVPKCVAADATSGVASCRVTTAASTSANYRYATATATDKAGNTGVSAKVLYRATTVAAFKYAPSTATHGYRFTIYVTAKNAKGTLINVSGVRALLPVKTTSTGSGPANTTLSTYATRTGTGTYKVTFTAPRTRGYYRYALRVGNATITKVIRVV